MDCLEGLKHIPDKSVDCIIIDPPYGINYISNHRKIKHLPIQNDDTLFIPFDELFNKLKTTGAMFIFYSHKKPFMHSFVKNQIIWVKNNWTAGDLIGDFGNQYECIAFIPHDEFKLKSKRYSNVWFFDRTQNELHPTEKPVDIIKRMILSATNAGDIVLDCFMGSGTTAIACKQLQRRFIGFEIESRYVEIANKRLEQGNLLTILNKEEVRP